MGNAPSSHNQHNQHNHSSSSSSSGSKRLAARSHAHAAAAKASKATTAPPPHPRILASAVCSEPAASATTPTPTTTTTTTAAVDALDQHGADSRHQQRSLWDTLPVELRIMILQHAGPLSLFLCFGTLATPPAGQCTAQALWLDAIALDWHGDLHLLPHIELDRVAHMDRVVSRAMYHRLCARFPQQACTSSTAEMLRAANGYTVDSSNANARLMASSLLNIPMRHGWFDLLDFTYPVALGWWAIECGHTGLLTHLVAHHAVHLRKYRAFRSFSALDRAALRGSLGVLQLLHDAGNTACTAWTVYYAVASGRLDVVVWLARHGYRCTRECIDEAARRGHAQILQFLVANAGEQCTDATIQQATANGHGHLAEWLKANTPSVDRLNP